MASKSQTRRGISPKIQAIVAVLRRRTLLVAGCVVIVTALAVVASPDTSKKYSASAFMLVPAYETLPSGQETNAYDAQQLADTYSVLLKRDDTFIRSVADLSSIDAQKVRDNLLIVTEIDTAVMRVTWSSKSRSEMDRFFAAFSQAATANPPASESIIPGTITTISIPDEITAQESSGSLAIPLGIVLGFALGIAASVMLERAFPRLDTAQNIAVATSIPSVDISRLTDEGLQALKSSLTNNSGDGQIVVTGLASSAAASVPYVLNVLNAIPASTETQGMSDLVAGGALNCGGSAERAAQLGTATVIAIPFGTSMASLSEGITSLEKFNAKPAWILAFPKRLAKTTETTATSSESGSWALPNSKNSEA